MQAHEGRGVGPGGLFLERHCPLCRRMKDAGVDLVDCSSNGIVPLCRRMKDAGVDLVDCSSGGIVPGIQYPSSPGYQVKIAEEVRAGAGACRDSRLSGWHDCTTSL